MIGMHRQNIPALIVRGVLESVIVAGTPLVTFDRRIIEDAGYSLITPVIVMNGKKFGPTRDVTGGEITARHLGAQSMWVSLARSSYSPSRSGPSRAAVSRSTGSRRAPNRSAWSVRPPRRVPSRSGALPATGITS